MPRLFNLDLHISVIADVKEILERLFPGELTVDSWCISGHTWVFKKPPAAVEIIRPETWTRLNDAMIEAFVARYKSLLSAYDGFIITHTPVFCRLFESFQKPMILVNSCRYDQPYCFPGVAGTAYARDGRAKLNACLARLAAAGRLVAISNNRADQDYLRAGAGIASLHLPSLCLYTGVVHDPVAAAGRPMTIACTHRDCIPAWLPLAPRPPSPYAWDDLMQRRGLVYIPYEVSTMSLYEHYSSGVPLFFPTKAFYRSLILANKAVMASFNSGNYDTRHLPETTALDWWLDRCDFYDPEWMPGIHYFDSWEDLARRIAEPITVSQKDAIASRRARIEAEWRRLMQTVFPALLSNEMTHN